MGASGPAQALVPTDPDQDAQPCNDRKGLVGLMLDIRQDLVHNVAEKKDHTLAETMSAGKRTFPVLQWDHTIGPVSNSGHRVLTAGPGVAAQVMGDNPDFGQNLHRRNLAQELARKPGPQTPGSALDLMEGNFAVARKLDVPHRPLAWAASAEM